MTTLPDSAEHPQPVPEIPLWSENICFSGWDRKRNIGVFTHQGRTAIDPHLWHEIVAVHLPDGRTHVGRNFSYGQSEDGPTGSLLSCEVTSPFKSWRVAFAGPLLLSSDAALAAGPLSDGRQPGVSLDLTWTSDGEIWDFTHQGIGDWGSGHYQQLGELNGRFTSADIDTELELVGWRDHSKGPRDLSPFVHHNNINAQFEDGTSFFAVQLQDDKSDTPVLRMRYDTPDGVTELDCVPMPVIDDVRNPSTHYSFTLPLPDGPKTVTVKQLCQLPVTMFPPNDMALGLIDGPGAYCLWMGQGRFELDGVVGYGHVERAARVL